MGINEIRALKGVPGYAKSNPEPTSKPSARKPINPISKKKAAKMKQEKAERGENKTELQTWYDGIMKKEDGVCWETGVNINKADKKGWHGSIAHVLPKEHFPSVATHPLNYIILSMWNGAHSNYDSSWSKASKMKVWPEAVDRFLQIYPSIAREERKKIPEVFLKELAK